jgi:hypothetical protein
MALPFKVGPDSSQRPAEADPFLEFESERPGRRVSSHPFFKDQLLRPEPPPPPDLSPRPSQALPPLPAILQTSKPLISPVVGFAVGVAGLAAAAVAYYQLAQFVAKRNAEAPPAAVTQTVAGPEADTRSGTPPRGAQTRAGGPASGTRDNRTGKPTTASRPTARAVAGAGVASATSDGATSGAVTFDSPLSFQVYAGGQLRGLSTDGNLTLPAGTRTVTLVNTQLEFRQSLPVTVQPGQPVRLSVPLPRGALSINALPWAEVWVDGSAVGTTPLANLALPIGSHEVVWRHPTLGERRQTVVVKTQTPARIGVDFNR